MKKAHTVLRKARKVLSSGEAERTRWRERVATNPKSKGSEDEGTIRSVYSTPMKNSKPIANKQGTQWNFATCATSSAVHVINDALFSFSFFTSMSLVTPTPPLVLVPVVVCLLLSVHEEGVLLLWRGRGKGKTAGAPSIAAVRNDGGWGGAKEEWHCESVRMKSVDLIKRRKGGVYKDWVRKMLDLRRLHIYYFFLCTLWKKRVFFFPLEYFFLFLLIKLVFIVG